MREGLENLQPTQGTQIIIKLQRRVIIPSSGTWMTMAASLMRRPQTLGEDNPKREKEEIVERIMMALMIDIIGRERILRRLIGITYGKKLRGSNIRGEGKRKEDLGHSMRTAKEISLQKKGSMKARKEGGVTWNLGMRMGLHGPWARGRAFVLLYILNT
jgi:hypothetical protein